MTQALSIAATIEPITGREELGELTEPAQALAHFYRAFNNRDLAMMEENWDHSDLPVIIDPLGKTRRGWREIRDAYERIFSSPAKIESEFYDYTLHLFGDLFYAVGRERGQYTGKDANLKLAAHSTNIFRRSKERWKQLLHHVSFEDPQLLATFQAARQ